MGNVNRVAVREFGRTGARPAQVDSTERADAGEGPELGTIPTVAG